MFWGAPTWPGLLGGGPQGFGGPLLRSPGAGPPPRLEGRAPSWGFGATGAGEHNRAPPNRFRGAKGPHAEGRRHRSSVIHTGPSAPGPTPEGGNKPPFHAAPPGRNDESLRDLPQPEPTITSRGREATPRFFNFRASSQTFKGKFFFEEGLTGAFK